MKEYRFIVSYKDGRKKRYFTIDKVFKTDRERIAYQNGLYDAITLAGFKIDEKSDNGFLMLGKKK